MHGVGDKLMFNFADVRMASCMDRGKDQGTEALWRNLSVLL